MRKFLSIFFATTIAMAVFVSHMNAQTVSGGWSTYSSEITAEASEVFETATKNLVGVSYEPIAVATQIVAGKNYSFFCNAKVVYPGALNEAAIVDIYQPLEGEPSISKISKFER